MSAKNESIVRSMVDAIRSADKSKTSPYDTQATVRRVENGVAWVHIPGGVDETPVKLTIAAKPGDNVQVRVSGGRAFLIGNASAPPTDDRTANAIGQNLTKRIDTTNGVLNGVRKVVESVRKIAANTNQYFWHTETGTDTGAHITEIPQEDFLRDPEHGGGNLLARSNGIAVRDGLTELAKFSADGIALGEDDAVIIAPSGATKTVWETDSLGQHSLPASIDLTASELYEVLPDGGGFGLNVDVNGIGVVSATFEKGVARDITILPIRIIYDGNHGLTISSESSQYTSITVIIFARIEKTGGILSFGQRSPGFTKGAFSATFGEGLIASAENQAVFGSYNEDDPSKILIVGGGFVHTSGSTIRANVFTVDKQGNIEGKNHKVGCVERGTDGDWTYYKYDDGYFDAYIRVSVSLTHYITSNGFYGYNTTLNLPAGCVGATANSYSVFATWKIGTGFAISSDITHVSASQIKLYGLGTASGTNSCVIDVHVHGKYQ